MAAPICTKASLTSESACFQGNILNHQDKLALEVYLMIKELAAIGGTDYSADFGQLNLDATDVFRDVSKDQREAFYLAMLKQNAENAGATISDDINVLKDEIKCLECYGMEMLSRMRLELICQLGTHKAYPQ